MAILGMVTGTLPVSGHTPSPSDPAEADCGYEDKEPICGTGRAVFERLLAMDQMGTASPPTTDILHCFLNIELNFTSRTMSGTNTLTVRSLAAGLSTFKLDLRDNMTVSAVTVDAQPAAYTRANHQITVALGRTYAADETFTVSVTYSGRPESLGWKSFSFTSSTAASLSQPWYAHTWWPCKDELEDKFTMDFWITVPADKTAVANGALQGTDALTGNRVRYRWRESYPVATYLVSVAASGYVHWTRQYHHAGGSMPVQIWCYPSSQSVAETNTAHLVTAIETYSRPDVFGEYPFINEKYGIAQFDGSVNMEHQTVSSHHAFDPNIINHELAHQWWGDMITCRTWHDIWLNEGFATYAEAIYHEKKPGGSMAAYMTRMNERRPSNYAGTVYIYDASSQSGVFNTNLVYRKAAWVLHMLRHVVGDQNFFDTLAAYRAAYEGRSATTEDFQRVAEVVCGSDLSWFFGQWVYGPGGPEYRFGWQSVQANGQHHLALHIRQVQTAYPLFRMPIDVTVQTSGGVATHVVWQEFECQWYSIPVDSQVTLVTLDKDAWILRPELAAEPYLSAPEFRLRRTSPLPGTSDAAIMRVRQVELQFDLPVACTDADFSVTGSSSGPRAFSSTCDAGGDVVRLQFASPLPAHETWMVHASDTIRSRVTGMSLDGELVDPTRPGSLPSGDGVPGGSAVFSFVTRLPGDFDADGDVDIEDFGRLQTCLQSPGVLAQDAGCLAVDLDHDRDVDETDLAIFRDCLSGSGVTPLLTCGS